MDLYLVNKGKGVLKLYKLFHILSLLAVRMIHATDFHNSYPLFYSEIQGSYAMLGILMCRLAPMESFMEQAGVVLLGLDQVIHLHESCTTIKLLRP